MAQSARLLLVEDDVAVAAGLRQMVEAGGYEVIGVARCGEQAIAMANSLMPDLVLMNVQLPGTLDGIDTMCAVRERHHVGVVYVSASADPSLVDRAVASGAEGYVVAPFVQAQIICTLKVALNTRQPRADINRSYFLRVGPDIWREMVESLQRLAQAPCPGGLQAERLPQVRPALSPREVELVRALIFYRHVSLAAEVLDISTHTARNHLKSVFRKLDVHSQNELFRLLVRVAHAQERGNDVSLRR
jgi:DNA-binding NarL/FixJ family response regulator